MRRLAIFLLGIAIWSMMGAAQQQPIPEGIIVQPAQPPLAIQLGLDKVSYAPGDRLRLTVSLSQSSYVYIYNIMPDRRVNLLFPNAYQPMNLLEAGTHTIPNQRYSLVISPPTGLECVQVLALAAPLPLEQLIPGGKLEPQNPFPLLSQKPQEFKAFMQNLIVGTVSTTGWAAAWTCFQIAQPQARLRIISNPSGALVFFFNNTYAGKTPLTLEIAPGRYYVVVTKEGYESWAQTLELKGNSDITLEATLKPLAVPSTPPIPPSPPISPPVPPVLTPPALSKPTMMVGFSGGLNAAHIPSVGFDFSFAIQSSFAGLGVSFLMTGENVPEYEDIGAPADLGPTLTYRNGPETELYAKLSLAFINGLGVDLAGGIAIQQEAHIALPLAPSSALDVVVKPNGYQTEKIYLTGLIGLSLRSSNLTLSAGVHNRRGWVIGIGVIF